MAWCRAGCQKWKSRCCYMRKHENLDKFRNCMVQQRLEQVNRTQAFTHRFLPSASATGRCLLWCSSVLVPPFTVLVVYLPLLCLLAS
eukprot:1157869-Pelagomonas_calceolata.AAC.11